MLKLVTLPVRALRTAIRVAGVRNSLLFGLGIAIGILIAPASGAQTRARLAHRLASVRAGDAPDVPSDADLSL